MGREADMMRTKADKHPDGEGTHTGGCKASGELPLQQPACTPTAIRSSGMVPVVGRAEEWCWLQLEGCDHGERALRAGGQQAHAEDVRM
jgi:hypothetical protein